MKKDYLKKYILNSNQSSLHDVTHLCNDYFEAHGSSEVPTAFVEVDGLNIFCYVNNISCFELARSLSLCNEEGKNPLQNFVTADYVLYDSDGFFHRTLGTMSFPTNNEVRKMASSMAEAMEEYFTPQIKDGTASCTVEKFFEKAQKAAQAQR